MDRRQVQEDDRTGRRTSRLVPENRNTRLFYLRQFLYVPSDTKPHQCLKRCRRQQKRGYADERKFNRKLVLFCLTRRQTLGLGDCPLRVPQGLTRLLVYRFFGALSL